MLAFAAKQHGEQYWFTACCITGLPFNLHQQHSFRHYDYLLFSDHEKLSTVSYNNYASGQGARCEESIKTLQNFCTCDTLTHTTVAVLLTCFQK
jgi:hypothetical protein